jgi:hypothetical protein
LASSVPPPARFAVANALERPRTAARDEEEFRRSRQRQPLVETSTNLLGPQLGPSRQEIEDDAAANVDPRGDPEIEQRVGAWPPQNRRDDALVGKDDGERIRREAGRTTEPSHSTNPKSSERISRMWARNRFQLSSRSAARLLAGSFMTCAFSR